MTTGMDVAAERHDDHERARRDLPVSATARRLQLCGLSVSEAMNLTAHLSGLRAVESGWTVRQIEHLLFLRSIVETGRLKA
jgi:hypothetical protein